MPPDSKRSNVRRSNVTACARCKSRKQRCDQNLPACSNCERAGVDYLKSLEDHVAQLERQLQEYRTNDRQIPRNEADTVTIERILEQASFVALPSSSFSNSRYMGTGSGLPLLRLLLFEDGTTTLPQQSVGSDLNSSSIVDLLQQDIPVQLPAHATSIRLIDAYFEHCDFFVPILYRNEVLRMLDEAADDTKIRERYKIFMILAISIQLLNRTDSSIPASRADTFFSFAKCLLLDNPANLLTGDLEHLENLLLLIQFSSFTSHPSVTWHYVGLATRLAIDLGLHDEPPPHHQLDPLSLDRRKRLFWATYTFERNLCTVLGRPVSIADEAIFVSLPVDVDDNYITEDGILPQPESSRKALALHLIRYRQLESEIMQVLHQKQPLISMAFNYELWRDDMRRRLYDWRATMPLHQFPSQLAPMEIFDGCLYNSLLQLFSPSRHMPSISSDDTIFLADCAQGSIEAYRSSFRDGKLRFYWRTVHNLFRAGVALVYSLKHWPTGLEYDGDSMQASLTSCSSVLWGMVERYPAGKHCRDTFDILCRSLRRPAAGQDLQSQPQIHRGTDLFPMLGNDAIIPADPSSLTADHFMLPNLNVQYLFPRGES
ncbi:hypothetical protein BU24DRAFT_408821 [Aaosphaeria arxii CBS 175.79]|uniref:Zn(2)-C6 fungal-type domain-containing protein n=1 Tax=Aaosphaeria arxii CBS 175.79 TaxID=1450172 RepID=A0A6A5XS86_9PLEO|nr:uncharacterized protein BU24DRAFT_408821 [Aaosphaeria arxii CBS 175.79]KAF2015621.1 hypothetical protein BU24DRAFT_408821 [Aaosphaeria arxii CBS 175.79]